jgi:uncharacterized OsmC-like protein
LARFARLLGVGWATEKESMVADDSVETVVVSLAQEADYRLRIEFGGEVPALTGDEPPPLGGGQGPSPVQLLAASVGSCLSDSLLFALRKYKQKPEPLTCSVAATVGRNPDGRLRVLRMEVVLTLGVAAARLEHLERAVRQFEQFCTVTRSVGEAIPIAVEVRDVTGQVVG